MKTKKILFGSTLLAAAALNFCAASANADTYTWAGTGEDSASWDTATSNWTTGGDDPVAWVNGDDSDATFTDDATNQSVTIDGYISAHTVEITGGSYTFTLGDSGSLSAKAFLKVDDGASLTIDGTGSVDFVSNATIGKEASLTINGGGFTVHGSVTVSDGGSIEIDGGDVYLTYTVTINSDASLTVSEGASLKISNTTTVDGGSIEITGGDAWFQNATNISNGGSLTITGGDTTFSGATGVTVSGEDSSINIEGGSVSFNRDVTLSDGGSIEISGEDSSVSFNSDVTIGEGASLNLNGGSVAFNGKVTGTVAIGTEAEVTLTGTIDLSEAISNSGTITVDTDDVTFVLNDSLKVDGTYFTYTFITNTEADEDTQTPAGSIVGWDSLSSTNFSVFDATGKEVTEGIGVVTKADGQATVVFVTEGENGTAITDYDFYIEAQSETTTTGNTLSGYTQFTGIGTLINGTVDGFVLQDRTSITGEPSAISGKNVYFAGVSEDGSDKLTITKINIATSTRTSNWYGGYEAFIVENATVILDGGVTGDNTESSINTGNLDMTLCVGTMSDATLEITNGAKITFNGVWSTVGSNGATGTINISGSGSELNNQQINIGMSVFSLSGGASTTNGYYFAQYLESDDERNAVIQAILNGSASGEGYEGSYGIVNVTDGGTWTVGVGNNNSSNSRIQLANGEINISGSGSQLLLGGASSLLMMGESSIVGVTWDENEQKYVYDSEVATGVMLTEKITVTDGGKVACAESAKLYEMVVGDSWFASNGEASISVSGSDDAGNASTFDLSFSQSAWIGTNAGYWNAVGAQTPDGGTQNVTISASDGGIFKISAAEGVVVAADNYYDYFASGVTAGHSYGLHVDITAESGGSITLDGQEDVVILGAGSPATADVDEDGVNDYTNNVNVTADGSVTGDDGTVTASSVTLSAGNIYANWHNADSVYVTLKATNGGAMTISATQGTTLNKNTTIVVDADSTLNTNGAVSFNAGSSLTVNAGGTWTSSGAVTVAAGASMDLNGTIDLSEAIQNSGSVTVNSDVVFVLSDSLLVEGSSATYALIINGDSGTITNWDSDTLGLTNFVYADGEALSDVVLDLSTAGYVKLLTSQGGVVIDYEYKTPWQRGDHGLSGYEAAGEDLYYFEAIKFDVSGVNATDFTLQDANETAITNKNVYIVGDGKDSSTLTITDIKVSNTSAGYYAFIVENATVVIDGQASENNGESQIVIDELGMSLCIGTMDSAELQITGGAQVSTSGVWSTIGSNMATGTLTISGEGSSLTNAQINIGMAVTSLSGGANEERGDGYYFGRFVQTESHYQGVLAALNSESYQPTDGSYGIVNVKEGGTWTISGSSTSNSRLQFSNGEINIDGEDSSLIFGTNSSLVMENMTSSLTDADGNSVTLTVSETLNVTNGGSVKNADGVTLHEILIGAIYSGSNGEAAIYVDGEGSTFDLSDNGDTSLYIGEKYETVAGGTEKVTISASNGGTLKLSSAYGINVGYTYASGSYKQADQMSISLTAESGGTITLAAAENGAKYSTYFGRNTATEETSTIDVKATGEGSEVVVSTNKSIWTNYNTSNFETSFVAEDGGKLTMTSGSDIVFGSGDGSGSATVTADGGTVSISGADIIANNEDASESFYTTFTATNGGTMELTATSSSSGAEGIHLNSNSSIIVENGSTLTTSSAKTVIFESGSSISVDATSTWTDYGSVTVAEGASMYLNGTIDLSERIQNSGEITVGEDVVFLLKEDDVNFKDEDEHFNFTYDFITNAENGSIEGWDSLSTGNFAVVDADNNEVTEGIGVVTKADGQATVVFVTESENGTATVDYDYYIDYQRSWTGRFYCIGITVDGTVDSFVLQDRTSITGNLDEITKDITGKDVLFIGSGATDADGKLVDSVTITEAKISNTGSSTNAFAVEGTKVIIDGVKIDELGMNIVVGTMYEAGDAELVITNGASVTTSAYYNTVGSNLNTGTITITGKGSTLANQQITLGGGVNSLFAATAASGQYQTKYFVDTDTYNNGIRDVLVSSEFDPTSGSYGIVNVTDGGTWKVGVGNTNSSNNRIQLANGEINIDGGSLIFGKNSSLLMMNESLFSNSSTGGVYTGMNISEKVTVTNGGTVSVEDNGTMAQLVIGDTYVASNVTAAVSVDGDGSSFIISASTAVYIGTNSGYWTNTGTSTAKYEGGTADVTVSATNGGVINLSSAGGMVICADNYATYIGATADGKIYSEAGHSYGLKVAITAEDGGSLTLSGGESGNIDIGAGSPSEGNTSSLTVSSTGTNSTLSISGKNITANYESSNLTSSYVATKGGSLELSATNQVVLGYGTSTDSSISVQAGIAEDKDNGVEAVSGGTVSISGSVVYTNYLTSGLKTSFGAYEGGTLTISAEKEIALGVGLDPQANSADDATSGGSMSITADGADSKVEISVAGNDGNQAIFINYETQEFTSTITASNGGSISMSAGEVAIGYSQPTSGVSPSGSATVTATGENSEITISATGDISTNTKGSTDLSVEITATNGGTINLIAGETADEPTPGSIKPLDDSDTGTIYLGNNTAVKVDADSTLNTTGAVTFDAGSSLTLAKDGSWTSNGSVTVAEGASMNLNGRVDLSETIQNSGSVTVNSDVVFVLNDSLKVEGTSATYAIIEGGTITSWDTLGTSNFVYGDLTALDPKNVTLDLSKEGYVKLLYTNEGVTIDYDYETPWQRGAHGEIGLTGDDLYYFRAIHIDVDGTAGEFTLSDANGEAITGKNVYFTGVNGDDKITITSANIANGDAKSSYGTQDSFIVEGCTVVFDGTAINIAELGMNLSIGTKADAELVITNGAQVRTGAYLNTVGANLATGTITISGEGSLLDNQQITLGAATNSEFGISGTYAEDGAYWIQYIETEEDFQAVIAAITSDEYDPTKDGSYGIVNVLDGATWQVGVGNSDSSISRIQLSNGEINIDGGSVILGNSSSLAITGENMVVIQNGDAYTYATGINYSQSITITNGGSLSAYEGGTIHSLTIGQIWNASNDTVSISVDGEGSSFVVATSDSTVTVPIGYNKGTWSGGTYTDGYGETHTVADLTTDGGSEKIDITASNGGVIDITAASSICMAYEAGSTTHSYGIDVSLLAETGGSITLVATTNFYLGYGQTASGYTSSIDVEAIGTDSKVVMSSAGAASGVYINDRTNALTSSFTASEGGSITLKTEYTDNSGNIIYVGYGATGGSSSFTADGGTVEISARSLNVNWQVDNFTTNFTAENGGTLTVTTVNQIIFGYSAYSTSTTATRTVNVTADGEGSTVKLSTALFATNYDTAYGLGDDTHFIASDGGKLSISAPTVGFGYSLSYRSFGSAEVKSTGSGSVVDISGTYVYTNYQTGNGFTSSLTAEEGGHLSVYASTQIGIGYNTPGSSESGYSGSSTVKADGEGSAIKLTAESWFITNWSTQSTFTSKFIASNGGSIYIESNEVDFGYTTSGYGTVNIESTGDGSLVDIYASSYIYFNGFEVNDLAVNISASDGGALIFSGTQVQFCANTKVEISSGGTLSTTATLFENTSSFSLDATSYWLSDGLATVEEGATLALNGRVEVTTAISNEGTITVSGSSLFVLSSALQDKTDENTYIVIVTDQDSITTWHDLTAANFIFDDGSNLGRSVVDVSTDGVVTITEVQESATLIWNGKESLHEWDTDKNDKDWKNGPQDDSFYTGDNVIFNEVAEDKDVLIHEQNLIAGTITVEVSEEAKEADPETTIEYTFDFDNKASLEGESLSVGDGASLTVTGDGSLEIDGETDIAGDMTVTGGAKANFDDGVTIDGTGSLTVTSDEKTGASGSVNVSGDLDVEGSLSVEDGSLTADNLTLSKGEEAEDGASAEFSGGETNIKGTVSVDENSSLTVSGDGSLTADSVEVAGTFDFEGGTLNTGELTIASDDKTTLKGGDLNIGSLTVGSGDSVTFGDGLTVGVYGDDDLDLDLDINLDGSVGFDTSNGDIEIEGTISDNDETTGSLTKTGSGTLTLDGENTYTGGTTIDEGTIEADNTSALGTGEVDIHKGATLKIHSHDDSGNPDSFENSTTGEGTLEIVEGEINLGDVGVQNVVVDKDATLEGNTTLTHSDASLDLKGTLEINVDNGEHITISDSGKVVIEYDAELDLESPSLGAGDSFVIVDGGTVTGDIDHFLGTDSTLSGLANDYAVIYDTSNGLSVSISKTGEQSVPYMRLHDGLYSDFIAAVITAEDMTLTAGIQGTGDVSSNPIARELLNGNVSRAIEMLNTLAPNDYAAMIAMPTTAFHNDVSSIDKRLAAVRAMPFSEDENARWGYFAQADGTFAENDNANDTPTFDFQLYGVLAGADYRMSNTLTVGVALGYDHEHAKLHNSGGRIDGDDVRVTVYAGAQLTDTVYANVGAQVGYGYYEARRHTVMGRASGETEGYNAGVFADIGMDLPLSEKHGISARPYVGLAYLRSFVRSFDDNLFDIGSFNNDSLRARVGLGVFWDLDGVSLGIDTSFSHDFCGEEIDDMSATYRATGSKFSMMAECLPEDVFSVGPVVSVGISEGLSAFAGYSFQAGSNEYTGHNVYIGVRASF